MLTHFTNEAGHMQAVMFGIPHILAFAHYRRSLTAFFPKNEGQKTLKRGDTVSIPK